MDFFKKRSVAVGVFVVTVILFTLIGSHRSLDRACRKAEDAFFDKSLLRSEGYHTCPGEQLAYCVDDANRLLSVIGSDGEWAGAYEALLTARRDLADALEARDIPAIGKASPAFAQAVQEVEATKESGAALPDSHDDYDAIIGDLRSAQALLDDSAYADHILAFREDVLGAFPANILRHLTGVHAPETFP